MKVEGTKPLALDSGKLGPGDWIRMMGLVPLPGEGGWFRETFRSSYASGNLPPAFCNGPHVLGTAIYYMLGPGEKSIPHRIPGDEIYHFYAGSPVTLLILENGTEGREVRLGSPLESGCVPQILVPKGAWQASRVEDPKGWALLGTTVFPGFEFSEWEKGDIGRLKKLFPLWVEALDTFEE
jgi:hypothetical protein